MGRRQQLHPVHPSNRWQKVYPVGVYPSSILVVFNFLGAETACVGRRLSFFCKLALKAMSCSTASQNAYDRICCRISTGNEKIFGSGRFAAGAVARGASV